MLFANPHSLWLLLLTPAFAILAQRISTVCPWRVGLLHALAWMALVLALARPLIERSDAAFRTVNVIELGANETGSLPSVDLSARLRSTMHTGPVVVFADRAEVLKDSAVLDDPRAWAALLARLKQPMWPDDATVGVNLADALRLAGACVPDGAPGHVRVLASGDSDHGDTAIEAWRLAQRGVDVKSEAALTDSGATVSVTQLQVPAIARLGQAVCVGITLKSTVAQPVTVRLTAGRQLPILLKTNLKIGMTELTANVPLNEPGVIPIAAAVWTNTPPTLPDPVRAAVDVAAASNVLVVQDTDQSGTARAMTSMLGSAAAIKAVTPGELARINPANFDAVVLADLPADHLPAQFIADMRRTVSNGGGLLITGAARSFGPGGYDDSPLAPLLPVKMPKPLQTIDPSTTLVLIIDTSNSMQGDRIDQAKEVARLALSHLSPHDKTGIVEFYGGRRWAAPIQSAGNTSVLLRALDRLTAGGGTKLFPAVEEAAFGLRNVQTRSKHVLIISDGFVENAPFGALVRRMADDGVVVSTVQVGATDGAGQNMMPDIARWGNGRFYTVADQYALPDLMFKTPQQALVTSVVRVPSQLQPGTDPLVRDVPAADWGRIDGYVRTEAKPTADTLLSAEDGTPILIRWRYGAGFVAALPTQLGSLMTEATQSQPAFARTVADLVRQLGSARVPPLKVIPTVRPAGVEVDVQQSDGSAGATASRGAIEVSLLDTAGQLMRREHVQAMGPGRWNVLLPNVPAGTYAILASVDDTGHTGNAAVAVSPPLSKVSVDTVALDRMESFAPLAASNVQSLPGSRQILDARPGLIVLAGLLLIAHVAARRWPETRAFIVENRS
jgi:hypothetical protein